MDSLFGEARLGERFNHGKLFFTLTPRGELEAF
jgi:hypothetical protein